MPQHENAHIIRTSDRRAFKTCRQQWDFSSKIRQNYEPNNEARYLAIGTALHAALETYYEPQTWTVPRSAVEPLAVAAFLESFKRPSSEALQLQWQEDVELGKGMLRDYFKWAPQHDKFTPKFVEIEFEVPVLWPQGEYHVPDGFTVVPIYKEDVTLYHLHYQGKPVYYQGRIDLIVEDAYGNYWIWDHKNVASLGTTEFLNMDEQCGSYMWAIQQMLGIKIKGVIYNELVKTLPHPPQLLVPKKATPNGSLSKNKAQNTTYELYLEAIAEHGFMVEDYEDILEHFKAQENKFIRRTEVHRTQRELENLGQQIALEAVDMLNSPSIYPNPNKDNCRLCAFRMPCLAKMEGSDSQWMLNEGFHVREKSTT